VHETWSWFDEGDEARLNEIRQSGSTGILSGLRHILPGQVWSLQEIALHSAKIEHFDMTWDVVESLPVAPEIIRGEGNLKRLFANYRQSLSNLAKEGISTVCYNFTPLFDWARTDLERGVPQGRTCFCITKLAAFDLFMLGRSGADQSYDPKTVDDAEAWFVQATSTEKMELFQAISAGIRAPCSFLDLAAFREALVPYEGLATDDLRSNLERFLNEVVPTAADVGISMALLPDDPPRSIFGLARVASQTGDLEWVMNVVASSASGICLSSGSLGAHPENDVLEICRQFSDRIHFAHLRNVLLSPDGSFRESTDLEGDINLVAIVDELLEAEMSRDIVLPFRADYGRDLLSDFGKAVQPGSSSVGQLIELSEMRGVSSALS
jgi:mannonate dehydratase